MFDQLEQLVQQFGNNAVVNNNQVPNEMNEGVMKETSSTIMSGLQGALTNGGIGQLANLLQGGNSNSVAGNPIVSAISQELVKSLGNKFGITSPIAQGIAANMIPKVLSSLMNNANNPEHKGFELSDIIGAISGGNQQQQSGLMEALGGLLANNSQQNNSNQPNQQSNGGIADILGKIFN